MARRFVANGHTGAVPLKQRLLTSRQIQDRGYKTPCWEWTERLFHDGYGMIKVEGKWRRVHRVAYECFKGRKLGRKHILHRCDNPVCFRPKHLRAGTNLDNVRDAIGKGRYRYTWEKGEGNPLATLTDKKVRKIRKLYATGEFSQEALAYRFGVTQMNISCIVRRKTWQHVK